MTLSLFGFQNGLRVSNTFKATSMTASAHKKSKAQSAIIQT